MIRYFKEMIKNIWHTQWVDHSNVKPKHGFDKRRKEFVLYSSAGIIKFKGRTLDEVTGFRDKFINEFERISLKNRVGIDTEKDFKKLYERIKKSFKVSHSANLKTRLKNVF